jgi:hypothetical protein
VASMLRPRYNEHLVRRVKPVNNSAVISVKPAHKNRQEHVLCKTTFATASKTPKLRHIPETGKSS